MSREETVQQWDTDRVLTVPNVLSFIRLAGVPVFGWLIISGQDLWAIALLAVFGATDWLDGFLARRLRQRTALGAKLDPVADRLYILMAVVAMFLRGIVPWWLLAVLLARDVLLACLVPFLRRTGRLALPVTMVGKAGTMSLLIAFPTILAGTEHGFGLPALWVVGWVFAVVGAVLYWVAGFQYVAATVALVRAEGRDGAS